MHGCYRVGSLALAAAVLAAGAFTLAAAAEPPAPQDAAAQAYGDGHIHSYHLQGNVWLMAGEPAETNVVVQIGPDGAMVVDTGVQSMARELLAKINALAMSVPLLDRSAKPINIIIDTSAAADHIGGNPVLREGGSSLLAGNAAFDQSFNPGAAVWANENVQTHMLAPGANGQSSVAQAYWPTQTRTEDLYSVTYNGEPVQLFHPHAAITDGDTMVLFRTSNVLVAGNTLDMNSYPVIDTKHGGTIDGELVALNRILDLAVPGAYEEGGTLIVPGHGHICDQGDAVAYRNSITLIRDRIQYYKNQGKTLAQVLALKPTEATDSRWGSQTGAWTTTDFVRAVYETLPAKGPSFSMQAQYVVPAGAAPGTRGREVY
jgi:glyoxylase-like metal-dependent hydrolase (beta-lactamase superfamily II)